MSSELGPFNPDAASGSTSASFARQLSESFVYNQQPYSIETF
jgi:hypothetical protein